MANNDFKTNRASTVFETHFGINLNQGTGTPKNFKLLDCVSFGVQQTWFAEDLNGLEVAYCSFLDCVDDAFGYQLDMRNIEIHHCYWHYCAWGVARSGIGSTTAARGPFRVHHCIIDLGLPVHYFRHGPGPNEPFGESADSWRCHNWWLDHVGDISAGEPFAQEHYYNTIIVGRDENNEGGSQLEYVDQFAPQTAAGHQKILNCIVYQVHDWPLLYKNGTVSNKRRVMYQQMRSDGNCWYAPNTTSFEKFRRLSRDNVPTSYADLAALKADSTVRACQWGGTNESKSVEQNPDFAGGAWPFLGTRDFANYLPTNAALDNVALDIRSTYNFPGASTSDPYAPYPGALQPDETKAPGGSNHIGPRPNSFASF